MAVPNPVATAYPMPPPPCSKETFCIAGILTTVYGLKELRSKVNEVACLWLLHPRLQTKASMESTAFSTINAWNGHLRKAGESGAAMQGLIAVAFDQRNHGSRETDALANQDWRSGNQRHAQDMFANYRESAPQSPYHFLRIDRGS